MAVPVLMITDPPYGVNYDPLWREEAGLGAQRQTGTVENDDRVDWSDAFALFPGDVVYVWHAGLYAGEVASSLERCEFAIWSQIIWVKQHFALSRGHYHWQHEPCWYAVRVSKPASWCGDRKQATVWEGSNLNAFGREKAADTITGHGTQKPVELMRRPLLNHTERGGLGVRSVSWLRVHTDCCRRYRSHLLWPRTQSRLRRRDCRALAEADGPQGDQNIHTAGIKPSGKPDSVKSG